jgi:hypothetical protein
MKTKVVTFLIASMMIMPSVMGASGGSAQEGELQSNTKASVSTDIKAKAGLVPGDFFYFTDQLMEEMQVWVANDAQAEAKLWASIAEERWAESMVLEGEARAKYEKQLKADYESSIQLALTKMEKARENTTIKLGSDAKPGVGAESSANKGTETKVGTQGKVEASAKAGTVSKAQTDSKAQTGVKVGTAAVLGLQSNVGADTTAAVKSNTAVDLNTSIKSTSSTETTAEVSATSNTSAKSNVDIKANTNTNVQSELDLLEEEISKIILLGEADLGVKIETSAFLSSALKLGH